jgi:UbiD family decarboxylase
MSLREQLSRLEAANRLARIRGPVSSEYEMAGVLKKLEPRAALFEQVDGQDFRVAGNLFCAKGDFAAAFGVPVRALIPLLARAIDQPQPYQVASQAPCQEVVDRSPDLDHLPILRHCARDGGRYVSSGVVIARHPLYGQNADFHRLMQF